MTHQDTQNKKLRASIGVTARNARLQLGLTQEDVAERVGLVTEVYGRLERGAMAPSVYTFRKLCLALGVSADKLLDMPGSTSETQQEAAPRPPPEPREVRLILRRSRKLSPRSLRVLSMLTDLLPVRTDAPEDAEEPEDLELEDLELEDLDPEDLDPDQD